MRGAGEAPLSQALWALSVWQVRPADEWTAAWWVARGGGLPLACLSPRARLRSP
jgi:hypothetical protein